MTTGRINQVTTVAPGAEAPGEFGGIPMASNVSRRSHLASSEPPGRLPRSNASRRHRRPRRGMPAPHHATRAAIRRDLSPSGFGWIVGHRPVVHGPHPSPQPKATVRRLSGSEESGSAFAESSDSEISLRAAESSRAGLEQIAEDSDDPN
jgi:hypothetical protein